MAREDDHIMFRGWRIKKELSVGDIVAFFIAAMAVIAAYYSLDKRLALVETTQTNYAAENKTQDADRANLRSEMISRLNRIDDKLDRLIERRQ